MDGSFLKSMLVRLMAEHEVPVVFRAHVISHDDYHYEAILEGREDSSNIYYLSINNSKSVDPFKGNNCDHLDFCYSPKRGIFTGLKMRIWPPFEGRGYSGRLLWVMHSAAKELGVREIWGDTVTNPGFWKHYGYVFGVRDGIKSIIKKVE